MYVAWLLLVVDRLVFDVKTRELGHKIGLFYQHINFHFFVDLARVDFEGLVMVREHKVVEESGKALEALRTREAEEVLFDIGFLHLWVAFSDEGRPCFVLSPDNVEIEVFGRLGRCCQKSV